MTERDKSILLKVTEQERRALHYLAKSKGLGLTPFIRMTLLDTLKKAKVDLNDFSDVVPSGPPTLLPFDDIIRGKSNG